MLIEGARTQSIIVQYSAFGATLYLILALVWFDSAAAQKVEERTQHLHYTTAATDSPERAELRPVWASRWCLSPLAPYGTGELARDDQGRPVEKSSWFRDLPLIRIRIDTPGTTCNGVCRRRVSNAVADSLTLWRSSCGRCSYDFLAAVIAPNALFLDERIYEALSNRLIDPYSAVATADSQLSGVTSFKSKSGHVIVPYYRVAYADPVLERFCRADSRLFSAGWASKLWSALCRAPAHVPAHQPHLSLSFVMGDTACGSAEDFLACGNPSKAVELTLWQTRYEAEASSTREHGMPSRVFVIGDPAGSPTDLHAVLLHEIGHFLGLPHLQDKNRPGSLKASMQTTLNNDMCVSIADIMMLTSAADALWSHRAIACSGLRRPARR